MRQFKNEYWFKLKSILNQCLHRQIYTNQNDWHLRKSTVAIQITLHLLGKSRAENASLYSKAKSTNKAINSKPLWRYIKSKRQDGVSPLKENEKLHSDSRRKTEILNNKFCSVST